MKTISLIHIAYARSGDKGCDTNIGVIARKPEFYTFLVSSLTCQRVKEQMQHVCKGEIIRYEMPNIYALNFILKNSLNGGGSLSSMLDAQGKTHAAQLLEMELTINEHLYKLISPLR